MVARHDQITVIQHAPGWLWLAGISVTSKKSFPCTDSASLATLTCSCLPVQNPTTQFPNVRASSKARSTARHGRPESPPEPGEHSSENLFSRSRRSAFSVGILPIHDDVVGITYRDASGPRVSERRRVHMPMVAKLGTGRRAWALRTSRLQGRSSPTMPPK